ncbi:MAG: TonB-dependent receptor [Acidobacteriota bacterium]
MTATVLRKLVLAGKVLACLAIPLALQATPLNLEGVVVDANGTPVAGARIAVVQGDAVAISDDDGRFVLLTELEALTAEGLAVVVEAPDRPAFEQIIVGTDGEIRLQLPADVASLDEIQVSASYSLDRQNPISDAVLGRDQLLELPHFGDDVFRALSFLPGVGSNDVSSQFTIRGSLRREVGLQIDGIEIFEPYHLKDFQGVFSILDPEMIGTVELLSGGYPSEYGDRLAGVLDIRTQKPSGPRSLELGVSLTNGWINGQGLLAGDRGRWLGSLRRGYLDLVLDLVADDEEETEGDGPQYWDAFGKLEWDLTPTQTLSFHALAADDTFDEQESEVDDFGFPEREVLDTSYGNSYLWGRHQALIGSRGVVETVLSAGRVDRDRRAEGEEFDARSVIRDQRQLDVYELRQDWTLQATERQLIKWGLAARAYDAEYDYQLDFSNGGFTGDRDNNLERRFADDFSSESYSLYAADRLRLGDRLVFELGLRHDRQTLTDEDQTSPRFNAVYDLRRGGILRAAWGRFHQSQRPHELQVEDGETRFFPSEVADHLIIGYQRDLRAFGQRLDLRLDAFDRRVRDPRPRYDNLFDAFTVNPEATVDRIRLAPESSRAQGIELFLGRQDGGRVGWWASYSWSQVDDRIDGRDVPRSNDQTHAFKADLSLRLSPRWRLNLAGTYRTGWPTTAIAAEAVTGSDGEIEIRPLIGPLFAERLDDYHRVDLRASRFVDRRNGNRLEIFVEIQNLYNRENQAGFSVDGRNFVLQPDGSVRYDEIEETWLGIVPSFGVSWRF